MFEKLLDAPCVGISDRLMEMIKFPEDIGHVVV